MTEERDMITLEFEDKDIECEMMGIFEANGKEYIALIPEDGTDDVWIFGYTEVGEDEFDITEIEDDEEFEMAVKEFDAIMAEQE